MFKGCEKSLPQYSRIVHCNYIHSNIVGSVELREPKLYERIGSGFDTRYSHDELVIESSDVSINKIKENFHKQSYIQQLESPKISNIAKLEIAKYVLQELYTESSSGITAGGLLDEWSF